MTDVSAGFRPPCWCPCTWAPTWRLHTNLYKFGENVSSHIFHEKNCCDLDLGESLCMCTFFLFPDSGLNLLNGLDFLYWSILNGVTLKTSNSLLPPLRVTWQDFSYVVTVHPRRSNLVSRTFTMAARTPTHGLFGHYLKITYAHSPMPSPVPRQW